MTVLFMTTIAAAVFLSLAPLPLLEGPSRRRFIWLDVVSYAFFLAAIAVLRLLPLSLDWNVLFAIALALKLIWIVFSCYLAEEEGTLRWSASKAALIAGGLYLILVPYGLQWPLDGDEPYYLLQADSILRDHDLDLTNQFRTAGALTGRGDLGPQVGDPLGPAGELYSRHEPFLAILLLPGTWLGGKLGAALTIALFGCLLIRSTLRFLEEEGISRRTMVIAFGFVAFGPPILFYATRIWPEVPGAWFFVEAVRGLRSRRPVRFFPFLLALGLLKLRFLLAAAVLLVMFVWRYRRWRPAVLAAILLLVPMGLVWWITGNPLNVHSSQELALQEPLKYVRGLAGSILDGGHGILFQAPFYFLAALGLAFIGRMPEGYRAGLGGTTLYLLLLIPREEWHGGWAPPLRYLVMLMPVLALGAAAVLDRWARPPLLVVVMAVVTAARMIHGIAFPWRLFHIADGQNAFGEWLSLHQGSDFSRLFPSFVRLNRAALIAGAILVMVMLMMVVFSRVSWRPRILMPVSVALMCVAIVLLVGAGRKPGPVVEFEDAHVEHMGGALYPEQWTVARFRFRGGWALAPGDKLTFKAREGRSVLHYFSTTGALLEVASDELVLPVTLGWTAVPVTLDDVDPERFTIECISGTAVLDRLQHE